MTTVLTAHEAPSFEADIRCQSCHTAFHVDRKDLQVAHFRPPATYWFDGAGDATTIPRFYVACPTAHCTNVVTICDSRLGEPFRDEPTAP
jgi:hypothetical protein